jgi:hypothetical protein
MFVVVGGWVCPGSNLKFVPYLLYGKVKVKLSLCLTKHHTMKAY